MDAEIIRIISGAIVLLALLSNKLDSKLFDNP